MLSRLVASTLGEPVAAQAALRLDEAARELLVDGQRVALSAREFELLAYLMQREGQAVKRGDLLDDIWGPRYEGGSNVIDTLVLGLRKKLGARAGAIETVVRFGYRFRQPRTERADRLTGRGAHCLLIVGSLRAHDAQDALAKDTARANRTRSWHATRTERAR